MEPSASEPAAKEPSGYHYWHDKVAHGEGAAPVPEPQLLASTAAAADARGPPSSIDSFGLLDDEDKVKVYVALEGDLLGVTDADVTATFHRELAGEACSMEVLVRGAKRNHRLAADKLAGPVVPEQCKARISAKNNKLVVTLKKANNAPWEQLRAKIVLPYRRGGGGAPR
jgi:hypothetical protein